MPKQLLVPFPKETKYRSRTLPSLRRRIVHPAGRIERAWIGEHGFIVTYVDYVHTNRRPRGNDPILVCDRRRKETRVPRCHSIGHTNTFVDTTL